MTASDSTLSAVPASAATVGELLSLLKPRVMTLVVFTGAVGLLLAPGSMHPFLQLLAIACIALGSGAGGMINMWYDQDIDSIMKRTANRPLPAGKVNPDDVLILGLILSGASVMMMGLAINWLAAGILAFAIFFYAVIYTMWLKRSTSHNIVIGGAAGAFPPAIGWAAMAGNITIEPLILFSIIFLWTPPHFWALALFSNQDYQRANIPMMPVKHGAKTTTHQMFGYALALALVAISPYFVGMSGVVYLAIASVLSGYFAFVCAKMIRQPDNMKLARHVFWYSIIYLFLLFSALLVDSALAPFIGV